ncbi:hypothetical protein ACMGG8_15755 [Pseudomonas sp. BNK-45]|uniref:hypothetical protein n=1 Tax=Pseudomonas sp. BNK-45 TaxID=3376180 RepID=UPI0039BF6431
MSYPEAYRQGCLAISQDMADAKVIDQAQKLDLDEFANAAYWHAVETLIDCEPEFMSSAFYDLLPQRGGPRLGTLSGRIYYPEGSTEWAAQVIDGKGGRRLEFRISSEVWAMCGLTITTADGSLYNLVITGQRINGHEYSNIDDPDAYRTLADQALVALENQDFETYRRARPLLLAAAFRKCTVCLDRFSMREDCQICNGRGFVTRNEGLTYS